ncbi:MAG: zinc-ribbon domain-containing protein [Pseudomonadota bacterium]
MLIVCPHCATSYQIAPESLGDNGRSVRCASCHSLWFAHPNDAVVHATTAAPEQAAPTLIRPPLNDVVAIGAGTADEPANGRFDDPTDMVPPDDAPSIVPGADTRFDKPKGIERAALAWERKRAKRRPLVLSRHAMPAMIIVLGLVLVCLIAGRQQIVRLLPQTASLYARIGLPVNLRGLAFENIKTTRDIEDGVPILIVEGEVVGTTGRHTEVPRLRFAVTDNTGKEIYAWTARPAKTLLPPGEVLPFRSRLASPPAEASGVTVRFFNRHDAKAGFM